MAVLPLGAPPKPANQGGNAPSYTQPLAQGLPYMTGFDNTEGAPNVMNNDNMPHQFASLDNNWQAHGETTPPGGYGGSGNGAS